MLKINQCKVRQSPCRWARRAASLTQACASWSPSPCPPPGGLPHSRAGTPGSAGGPQRLARRVPGGGPPRSPWRAHPVDKVQVEPLPGSETCSASRLCGEGLGPGRGPPTFPADPAYHPAHSNQGVLWPHSGFIRVRKGDTRALGLLLRTAGWGRPANSSHSVPRDEARGRGGPQLAGRLGHEQYDPPHRMFPMSSACSSGARQGSGCASDGGSQAEGRDGRGSRLEGQPRKGPPRAGRTPPGARTHCVHRRGDVQVDPDPRPVEANV